MGATRFWLARQPTIKHLVRIAERYTLKLAGGWYSENIFFRHRIFSKSTAASLLHGLAWLPLAIARRSVSAILRRVEFTRVEIPITTRCSLNCRDCANLIPFYSAPAHFSADELIRDVDEFLGMVDRVHSFSVLGGEACLHPELARVIAYLIEQKKVGTVQLATNATIVPKDQLLRVLAHPKVVVSVSDYPNELVRNKCAMLAKLKEWNVNFVLLAGAQWKDFGGFAPRVDESKPAMAKRFRECSGRKYHNLLDGEFHLCPRSAHGSRLGQFQVDPADFVQCRGRKDRQNVRAELRELCRRPYIAACTRCKGGVEEIPPAIQMPRPVTV